MNCDFSDVFLFIFCMVYTRGYGLGGGGPERPSLTNDDIHDMIATQVTVSVWKVILEFFGSIKTMMIELFNERYVALTDTNIVVATIVIAVTGGQIGG